MPDDQVEGTYRDHSQRVEVHFEGPPDTGYMTVRFLGDVKGTVGHWPKGVKGFQPCPGEGRCLWHKWPLVWAGFASGLKHVTGPPERWTHIVLDVTERLYRTLGGEALRGTQWRLSKRPCGPRTKESWGEQLGDVDPRLLPRELTVEALVERAYRVRPMQWAQEPLWEGPTFAEVIEVHSAAPLIPRNDPLEGFTYTRSRKGMRLDEVIKERDEAMAAFLASKQLKEGGS